MANPKEAEGPKLWLDLGMKLLSLLILPLLGLGVSMYTEASVTREKVAQLGVETRQNRDRLESVDTRINQISLTVQETNGQVHELRTILDIIRGQVSTRNAGDRQ
jgi:hypothetical protein